MLPAIICTNILTDTKFIQENERDMVRNTQLGHKLINRIEMDLVHWQLPGGRHGQKRQHNAI